jgi:hypothetical protein
MSALRAYVGAAQSGDPHLPAVQESVLERAETAPQERHQVTYDEYMQSAAWRTSAAHSEALRRAEYRCQGCNTPDALEAHHG